jgi:hypothetical protein
MSKKKTLPSNYIAFDDYQNEFIATGTREQVIEAIQEYIDIEELEGDEIEQIKVFELGKEKLVLAHIRFDVTIGE